MRKVHLLFLPVLLLSACSNKDNVTDTDLIISECVVDSNIDDRAIEFYNKSDQTIDLNKYSLVIYQGSGDGHTEIDFNGELESHKTFVIAYSNASEEIKNKADLISEYLIFDGTWPMTLNKGNKVVDVDTVDAKSGKTIPAAKFPMEMKIDWVRYYTPKGK